MLSGFPLKKTLKCNQRSKSKSQSWETSRGSFLTMPEPPDDSDIVRDQHGQRSGSNRLSPAKKVEEERPVGSGNWKIQRSIHAGSLPSKGSRLGHSGSSKSSSCIDAVEKNVESQSNTNVRLQSSEKKTHLGWGEGLVEYEKKVEGRLGSKPERDLDDKSLLENVKMSGHVDNLSHLLVSGYQSAHKGSSADIAKLDMSSIAGVDSSLLQLLSSNDISLDSCFAATTSIHKLSIIKDVVLKACMKIESEIDLLEYELKSSQPESAVACASSKPGSFTVKVASGTRRDDAVKPFKHVESSGDSESKLCELILSSNKEEPNRARSALTDNVIHDVAKIGNPSRHQDDSRIRGMLTRRKRFLIFKERVLAIKFKAFHHLWQKHTGALPSRNSRLRSRKRLRSGLQIELSGVTSPANMSLAQKRKIIDYTNKLITDSRWRISGEALKMPALVLDEREKIMSRFLSTNGLVKDPCAVEKERAMINPWTANEREIFLEKFGKYGKDFSTIASFLDSKTTADCVEFYYKNNRSEFFKVVKKNLDAGEEEATFCNRHLATPGRIRDRKVNAGLRWTQQKRRPGTSIVGQNCNRVES